MEQSEEQENNKTASFLVFTFGVGFLLIACLIYVGANGFNFWFSILLGGVAQVTFRVVKRMWSNSFQDSEGNPSNSDPIIRGFVDTLPTFKIFGLLYIAMVGVSALWYGIGALVSWLF